MKLKFKMLIKSNKFYKISQFKISKIYNKVKHKK